METDHHEVEWAVLEARATDARDRAYAPYSRFHVGAAVVTPAGIYVGANVENTSYGATLCAERAATAAALVGGRGQRGTDVRALLVVGGPEGAPPVRCAPCGICRQVLHELNPAMAVRYRGAEGWTECTAAALLPDAFGLPGAG